MNEYLKEIISNDVPIIKFNKLEKLDYIRHGFSTRLGGVSKGIFTSMNLSFGRNDNYEDVLENYNIISKKLDVKVENMVASAQTHTTNVLRVTKSDCGKGIILEKDYNDVDGLITNEKDVVLVTYYADCVPLYFVDTQNKAIGLSHSGWKGTVNNMAASTISRMSSEFGTSPDNLVCVIGPSICQECYEVSEDVALQFKNKYSPNEFEKIVVNKNNGKYLLDLWKANEINLVNSGVLVKNIENRKICTCCNKEYLFSHRGLDGKRGNLAAFLSLI